MMYFYLLMAPWIFCDGSSDSVSMTWANTNWIGLVMFTDDCFISQYIFEIKT